MAFVASRKLASVPSVALSSQISFSLTRRGGVATFGTAVSRGTTSSVFSQSPGRFTEHDDVLGQGKHVTSDVPMQSSSRKTSSTSSFERSVVVPLPGMLLTRELFEAVRLGDALVGNASAIDSELGETVIRSAASLAEAVDLLIAGIMERHPGRQVVLVGHSYGGYAALEVAKRAPNLLSGLVLMSTQLRADTKGTTARRESRVRLARDKGVTALIDELIPVLLSPTAIADANKVKSVYRMAEDTGIEAFAKQMRACCGRSDQRGTLSALHPSLPVFVTAGGQDKLIPPKCLHELRKELKDREKVCNPAPWEACSYDGIGHLMALENPEALHADISSWAASVRLFPADTIEC